MQAVWTIQPGALPPQSVFVGVGIVAAAVLAPLWGRRGADLPEAAALTGLAIGLALLGGAGWAALFAPGSEARFASFGALGGAAGAALIWACVRGVERTVGMLDGLVPAGLIGLAIARLGCLSAGCDYGAPTRAGWGIAYAAEYGVDIRPLHPFPLYLVGVTLTAVAVARFMRRRSPGKSGLTAFFAAQGYLVARFGVEFVRHPASESMAWGGMGLNQLAAGASVAGLIGSWRLYTNILEGRHDAD